MKQARQLTATSFAILGLLALRSWSTYELAKQIRRTLIHIWPRAESNLYAEVKRLAAEGYATTKYAHAGGRRRTVYAITTAGRRALRRWLAEPRGDIRLEAEPLLKVFFADQSEVTDLLATIRAVGDSAERQQAALRRLALEYRDGAGPFPERLPVGVLALGLVFDQLEATIAWSRRAQEAVAGWRSTSPGGPPLWPANVFSSRPKR